MNQLFGDYREDLINSKQDHLTIVFSPTTFTLQERWRNNSLSADFLADYFANFFPGENSASTETSTRGEIKGAISYIANELLENAVKFNYDPHVNISLTLQLDRTELIFLVTNSLDSKTVEPFHQLIRQIITSDPGELYIQKLEANAANEDNTESGLGFLTMLNDYGVKLGWKFHCTADKPQVMLVSTMVYVRVQEIMG